MNLRYIVGVIRALWDNWDVRGLMMVSFSLQTCLFFVSPFRQRSSNKWLISVLFCIYLLADWAANYAAGVISITQNDTTKKNAYQQPLAFWCPFLLVHLGGADSITAFTLQDNDFWHRHALAILFQTVSSSYIFFETLANNKLWIPTLLVFVSGLIKYYERTLSLYRGSFNNLRESLRKTPDPGPNYSGIMSYFSRRRGSNLPTKIEMVAAPTRASEVKHGRLKGSHVMPFAYKLFEMAKRLAVDLKCSHHHRRWSREFFLGRTAKDAFGVIEIELSFLYDILFTKASVLYTRNGIILRSFSFVLMVTCCGLFYHAQKELSGCDVAISYTLLLGAIVFDLISLVHLITDKWASALLKKHPDERFWIPDDHDQPKSDGTPRWKVIRFLEKRWSESVSTLSLIEYCVCPRARELQGIMESFGVTPFFDGLKYVKRERFTDNLMSNIFQEVRNKSIVAENDLETVRQAIKARGDWVLRLEDCNEVLRHYVIDMDFDQSLLTWHIATELCWYNDNDSDNDKNKTNDSRGHAKLLSEYMMYLVKMQPAIMYGVTDIGQTRLWDTCAEMMREGSHSLEKPSTLVITMYAVKWILVYFVIGIFSPPLSIILSLYEVLFVPIIPAKLKQRCPTLLQFFEEEDTEKKRNKFCKKIHSVDAVLEPVLVKGDGSKSVLFDACRLAKVIMNIKGPRKWEIVSRVWVEMLSYAAVHCRPQTMAEQLSSGGELLSFVWLLMAHFGLVDQFEVCGSVRANIVVDK